MTTLARERRAGGVIPITTYETHSPLFISPEQPSDPESGRRERVALAGARVAGFGGTFSHAHIRNALRVARAYAARRAPVAELVAVLGEVKQVAEKAREWAAGSVWTVADASRATAAGVEHRAARAVADALGRALDPVGCLRRPPAAQVDRAWLTTDVVALARLIAGTGQLDLLPILADALQDAGCAEASVLDHCRCSGPHAPECWVVESILAPGSGPSENQQ